MSAKISLTSSVLASALAGLMATSTAIAALLSPAEADVAVAAKKEQCDGIALMGLDDDALGPGAMCRGGATQDFQVNA